MSNPLPLSPGGSAQRGSAPNSIEPSRYPGLEDLRRHCSRDGVALIDRVYRDALALHKRAVDAEAELALYDDTPRRDAAEQSAMGISPQEAEDLL